MHFDMALLYPDDRYKHAGSLNSAFAIWISTYKTLVVYDSEFLIAKNLIQT